MKAGSGSGMPAAAVIDHLPRTDAVWSSTHHPSTDAEPRIAARVPLAEQALALYVGSACNFGFAGVTKMPRI
jgi:hypothetical protein